MKAYRFDPDALGEYEAAARWYAERSTVAPAFVAAVEKAILQVRRTAHAFARWPGIPDQEVRRCVLRRFPFVIAYRVERNQILIAAVAHARREPGYWLGRLRRE